MKCVVQKFSSYKEAEAANRAYYRSLTPQQRLEIFFELLASQRAKDGTATGLGAFAESLNAAKVKYVIVGGYAVVYHGHPRFTGDIDIFVESSQENAERIIKAIDSFGFSSLGLTAKDFLAPDTIVQIGYPPNRVDLLTSVAEVPFVEAWASRQSEVVDHVKVSFLAKDLLIRNKRAVGRPKDLADIQEL